MDKYMEHLYNIDIKNIMYEIVVNIACHIILYYNNIYVCDIIDASF